MHPLEPIILTTREDIEIWMNAPAEEALKLQRPLLDNSLTIAARPPSSFLSPLATIFSELSALQLERFLGWRVHPNVDLLPRRQNDGHCLRMERPDLLVRSGRQKREDVICCFAFLHFPNGGPARPDAGKKAN